METDTKRCKACNLYKTSEGFRPGRAVCRACERKADRARRARAKHGGEPEPPAPEAAPEPEAARKLTGDEAAAAMQRYGLYLDAIQGEPSPIMHTMQIRMDYGIDRGPDYSIRVRDRFARRIPDPRADELAGREVWRNPPPGIEPPPMKIKPASYSPPARILAGKTYCIKGLRP